MTTTTFWLSEDLQIDNAKGATALDIVADPGNAKIAIRKMSIDWDLGTTSANRALVIASGTGGHSWKIFLKGSSTGHEQYDFRGDNRYDGFVGARSEAVTAQITDVAFEGQNLGAADLVYINVLYEKQGD